MGVLALSPKDERRGFQRKHRRSEKNRGRDGEMPERFERRQGGRSHECSHQPDDSGHKSPSHRERQSLRTSHCARCFATNSGVTVPCLFPNCAMT